MKRQCNAPDSLHEGRTRRECLLALAEAAEAYEGEPIPPGMGDDEHVLHFAVRVVESYSTPTPSGMAWDWKALPDDQAKDCWGRIMNHSRDGVVDVGRSYEVLRDFGPADPEAAKQAARELAAWSRGEIECAESTSN